MKLLVSSSNGVYRRVWLVVFPVVEADCSLLDLFPVGVGSVHNEACSLVGGGGSSWGHTLQILVVVHDMGHCSYIQDI